RISRPSGRGGHVGNHARARGVSAPSTARGPTMSEADTKALIRRYLDAFNASDRDAMLDCLSDDVVHDINQGGREIGKEKFKWFNAEMARHYDEQLTDIAIMVA